MTRKRCQQILANLGKPKKCLSGIAHKEIAIEDTNTKNENPNHEQPQMLTRFQRASWPAVLNKECIDLRKGRNGKRGSVLRGAQRVSVYSSTPL